MDDPQADVEPRDASPPVLFGVATRSERVSPSGPDLVSQLGRRLSEIEIRMEKLAERFDQLEFVIVEQFEPGMTPSGDARRGNLRERLDRIEEVLGLLSQSGEERPAPAEASHAALGQTKWEAAAASLAETAAVHAERFGAVEARLDGLADLFESFAGDARGRHHALLETLEKLAQRPMPAPDLTAQHRSFAGFATALQVTLDRLDGAVAEILAGFASLAARLETLEAPHSGQDAPVDGVTRVGRDIGDGFMALCDRIGALTDVVAGAAERKSSAETAALSDRLEALSAVLSASIGDAAVGQRLVMEDALRDLRIAVAEIAAENRRLRIS